VALAEQISRGSSLAFDSDALIYFVEEHPEYLTVIEPVIDLVATRDAFAHISTINLLEVLVRPLRENRADLAGRYRELLMNPEDFTVWPVTAYLAEKASAIRAEFRVEVADSIVAATAIEAGCEYLITNNGEDFKRIRGLQTLIIKDFVTG
jgi:predicted nucleic acid-binding protein